MVEKYIPDRGDICWATLDPILGHEQKGRRPVLVLSPKIYNNLSGLAVICPITSQIKPYPFVVLIENKGVILADQIRSVSWPKRDFNYIGKVSPEVLVGVLSKIKTLLDL